MRACLSRVSTPVANIEPVGSSEKVVSSCVRWKNPAQSHTRPHFFYDIRDILNIYAYTMQQNQQQFPLCFRYKYTFTWTCGIATIRYFFQDNTFIRPFFS